MARAGCYNGALSGVAKGGYRPLCADRNYAYWAALVVDLSVLEPSRATHSFCVDSMHLQATNARPASKVRDTTNVIGDGVGRVSTVSQMLLE